MNFRYIVGERYPSRIIYRRFSSDKSSKSISTWNQAFFSYNQAFFFRCIRATVIDPFLPAAMWMACGYGKTVQYVPKNADRLLPDPSRPSGPPGATGLVSDERKIDNNSARTSFCLCLRAVRALVDA